MLKSAVSAQDLSTFRLRRLSLSMTLINPRYAAKSISIRDEVMSAVILIIRPLLHERYSISYSSILAPWFHFKSS